MAEKRIQDWLHTAVSGIRFKLDREAVEQELREHFEDKVADLQWMYHLDQEEAEEMALGQMGDAEEIGREMAKIHKPWWGVIWTVTRVLLPVVMVAAVFSWFGTGDNFPTWEYWDWDNLPGTWEEKMRNEYSTYIPNDLPKQLMAREGEASESVWVNGQHVSVRHASLWQEKEQQVLYLALRLDTPLFWERGILFPGWFRLTDNLGKKYDSAEMEIDYGGYGPFHQCVEVILQDVQPEVEWVQLDYGPEGEIFSLTVELEREAEK